MDSLFPSIPLIKVNLELIGYVLPKIFNKKTNKLDYFCSYIQDFFISSNVGHRRLMLKILDKCPGLFLKIPLTSILTQLVDLQEYPRALFFLEKSIRARIDQKNLRFFPELINEEELNWLKKIYSGLYRLRYIESIPKQCKTSFDENIELKKLFNEGNFLLLASLKFDFSHKFFIGSC